LIWVNRERAKRVDESPDNFQVGSQPPVKKQKKERDQTYYDQQFQFSVIAA